MVGVVGGKKTATPLPSTGFSNVQVTAIFFLSFFFFLSPASSVFGSYFCCPPLRDTLRGIAIVMHHGGIGQWGG